MLLTLITIVNAVTVFFFTIIFFHRKLHSPFKIYVPLHAETNIWNVLFNMDENLDGGATCNLRYSRVAPPVISGRSLCDLSG
jgi:hypothetical protein